MTDTFLFSMYFRDLSFLFLQNNYLAEAQQYAQETDLSRRVKDWEEKIIPVLQEEVCLIFPMNIH